MPSPEASVPEPGVVAVLDDPEAVGVALHPLRARLLALLSAEEGSAASLAAAIDLPRQKVTYHLRALADHGLVTETGRRRHGGLVERRFRASARSYLVSPAAFGPVGAGPERVADRLSSAYLLALAGRAIREVGALAARAATTGRAVPTLSVDVDVRFASPATRAAFADELTDVVADLAARHHDETAVDGRWYRLIAFAHPRPEEQHR